jgi:hypothetical protein
MSPRSGAKSIPGMQDDEAVREVGPPDLLVSTCAARAWEPPTCRAPPSRPWLRGHARHAETRLEATIKTAVVLACPSLKLSLLARRLAVRP